LLCWLSFGSAFASSDDVLADVLSTLVASCLEEVREHAEHCWPQFDAVPRDELVGIRTRSRF
jgi:hypothetical protein